MFKVFAYSNRSMRDLEEESTGYLWYKLLHDTLVRMDRNETIDKQEFLDFCRFYYVNDPLRLKAIDDFEKNSTASNAIQWYTKNFFPFNFVNKALRTEDVTALYKLRYFIIALCEQLKAIYVEDYEWYQDLFQPFIVYRGLTLSQIDIEVLIHSVGKYVSTNGFLSTSRSRVVADRFAGNVLLD